MNVDEKHALIKFILIMGVAGIGSLVMGLLIIMKKRGNLSSNYHMGINFLIGSATAIPCFVISLIYFLYEDWGKCLFKNDTFLIVVMIWLIIGSFIEGAHGLLKKKEINNSAFDRFSEMALYGSIIMLIGLICWVWLWGWPWSPHILFDWQKDPEAFLNRPIF